MGGGRGRAGVVVGLLKRRLYCKIILGLFVFFHVGTQHCNSPGYRCVPATVVVANKFSIFNFQIRGSEFISSNI